MACLCSEGAKEGRLTFSHTWKKGIQIKMLEAGKAGLTLFLIPYPVSYLTIFFSICSIFKKIFIGG